MDPQIWKKGEAFVPEVFLSCTHHWGSRSSGCKAWWGGDGRDNKCVWPSITVTEGGMETGLREGRQLWFQGFRWTPSLDLNPLQRTQTVTPFSFWLNGYTISNIMTVTDAARLQSHLSPLLCNNDSVWQQKGRPKNPSFYEADKIMAHLLSCDCCSCNMDWFCTWVNVF